VSPLRRLRIPLIVLKQSEIGDGQMKRLTMYFHRQLPPVLSRWRARANVSAAFVVKTRPHPIVLRAGRSRHIRRSRAGDAEQAFGDLLRGAHPGRAGEDSSTWGKLTGGLPPIIQANLAIAPSNPKLLYAMVAAGGAAAEAPAGQPAPWQHARRPAHRRRANIASPQIALG
jgi:hypothetical protein